MAVQAAAAMRLRGKRRTTTAIVQIIPTVGAPTSRRKEATARLTETAASSPLIHRAILRRGPILHPAAATRRRLVPTPLLLAAVTAEVAALRVVMVAEAVPAAPVVVAATTVEAATAADLTAAVAAMLVVAAEADRIAAEAEVRTVEVAAIRIANCLCNFWHSARSKKLGGLSYFYRSLA